MTPEAKSAEDLLKTLKNIESLILAISFECEMASRTISAELVNCDLSQFYVEN